MKLKKYFIFLWFFFSSTSQLPANEINLEGLWNPGVFVAPQIGINYLSNENLTLGAQIGTNHKADDSAVGFNTSYYWSNFLDNSVYFKMRTDYNRKKLYSANVPNSAFNEVYSTSGVVGYHWNFDSKYQANLGICLTRFSETWGSNIEGLGHKTQGFDVSGEITLGLLI